MVVFILWIVELQLRYASIEQVGRKIGEEAITRRINGLYIRQTKRLIGQKPGFTCTISHLTLLYKRS